VREFGVHADGAICIVADPKITIVPGFEPTFFVPQLEKTKPRVNQIVYRVFDTTVTDSQFGAFWTPVDPEIFTSDTFRVIAGLPDRQTEGDALVAGLLLATSAVFDVRPAAAVSTLSNPEPGASYRYYPGGLLEFRIDQTQFNVYNQQTKLLSPAFGGVPRGCEPAPRGCVGEVLR
jgi:hypothetical protein